MPRGTSACFRQRQVADLLFRFLDRLCRLYYSLQLCSGDLGFDVLGLAVDRFGRLFTIGLGMYIALDTLHSSGARWRSGVSSLCVSVLLCVFDDL
jgi:hypothetical protein